MEAQVLWWMNWKCGMCYVDDILAVGENVDKHLYNLKSDFALKGQPIARPGVHWFDPEKTSAVDIFPVRF